MSFYIQGFRDDQRSDHQQTNRNLYNATFRNNSPVTTQYLEQSSVFKQRSQSSMMIGDNTTATEGAKALPPH